MEAFKPNVANLQNVSCKHSMDKTFNIKFTRTNKIILNFFVFGVVTFFLFQILADAIFQKLDNKNDDFVDIMLNLSLSRMVLTIGFPLVINLTSIIRLLVAIKRNDELAKKAYKIITITTLGLTTLYFLYLQLTNVE